MLVRPHDVGIQKMDSASAFGHTACVGLHLTAPSPQALAALAQRSEDEPVTYAPVGATAMASVEVGYDHQAWSVELGHGAEVFGRAADALHSWDVRVAFDDGASVPEYLAELLVDRIPSMAGYSGKADRWTRPPASIALLTDGPDRRFTLELGDAVALDDGAEEAAADAVVRLPAESLLRLTAGRLAPARTPTDITVDGEVTLDELRAVFPGF